MAFEEEIKAFGMTNMLIESEIDQLEKRLDLKLRDGLASREETLSDIERAYFPQFAKSLRDEAAEMAHSYELFYCLEKTIRSQITELLALTHGTDWWKHTVIPQQIVTDVKKRTQRERESGITPRSSDPLDYTNFGELGEIIRFNWQAFSGTFNNIKAMDKVMFNLNSLRNPIAHCSVLAEDEVLRLKLSLRDWFRLMD